MKKDSKLCNFRLSFEGVACLERLAVQWTCSMTEAVERALLIAEAAVIAAPETAGVPAVREGDFNSPAPDPKVSSRAESVAQRRARETKEHIAKLAACDTIAREAGRDDIEYDPENVPYKSVFHVAAPVKTQTSVSQYEIKPKDAKPLTRPHGSTEAKRRREQQ